MPGAASTGFLGVPVKVVEDQRPFEKFFAVAHFRKIVRLHEDIVFAVDLARTRLARRYGNRHFELGFAVEQFPRNRGLAGARWR